MEAKKTQEIQQLLKTRKLISEWEHSKVSIYLVFKTF